MEESAMPGNWLVGSRDGLPYYVNTITGESTFSPPLPGLPKSSGEFELHPKKRKRQMNDSDLKSLLEDVGKNVADNIPNSWICGQKEGKPMFVNTCTGKRSATTPAVLRNNSVPTIEMDALPEDNVPLAIVASPAIVAGPLMKSVSDKTLMKDMETLGIDLLFDETNLDMNVDFGSLEKPAPLTLLETDVNKHKIPTNKKEKKTLCPKMNRIMRNRAAASRSRKKRLAKTEELEKLVVELKSQVVELKSQVMTSQTENKILKEEVTFLRRIVEDRLK